MKKKVVVFGEMLWDCLPSGAVPGGAPMNVAVNLHRLGLDSRLISAVGKDPDGEGLLDFLRSFDLPIDMIQVNDRPTSKVLVDDSDKENIRYDIVTSVAWDFIQTNAASEAQVSDSDAFVFGSLGVRNKESYQTLLNLLPKARLRIFDINLRPPFYDLQQIEELLHQSDIVKINEEELEKLALYFGLKPEMTEVADFLMEEYAIAQVCVTLGGKGAFVRKENVGLRHHGYHVKVEDTIGAGDAFLSGFIYQLLQEASLEKTLVFACKLGAFVAGKKGGTPSYSLQEIERTDFPEN